MVHDQPDTRRRWHARPSGSQLRGATTRGGRTGDDHAGHAIWRKVMRPRELTLTTLRRFALPQPDEQDDKDERGRVLAVGGSAEVPGALLLSGIAALRSGAGKLQLATVASAAIGLGLAVP